MKNNYDNKFHANPYPSSKKYYMYFILSMCNFFFMMVFAISRSWSLLIVSIAVFVFFLIKLYPYISLWDKANREFIDNERLRKELELEKQKKPISYSLPNLIISEFVQQLSEVLKPDDVWSYRCADVYGEILTGKVRLKVNGKDALVILNRLKVVEIVYSPTVLPEKNVNKKQDFSLYAFEWVETNLIDINNRREEAIKNESYEFYISDILPERKYWEAIVKALIQKGFAAEIIEIDDEEVVKISC